MVGHSDGFQEAFGFVVHAARTHGIHISPVFFHLRVYQRVAIHFGRRGHQNTRFLFLGKPQQVVRTVRAHFQGLNGHLQVIDGAGRRRKIQDVVEFSRNMDEFRDVVVVVFKIFFLEQVFNIGQVAGQQIVHGYYLIAFCHKAVAKVRTDKSGSAGDEHSFFCH